MKREMQVAFSRHGQPGWFRVVKWVSMIGVSRRVYGTPWFTRVIIGGPLAGVALHVFYRWKTNGWTAAWGGWDDPMFVVPQAR